MAVIISIVFGIAAVACGVGWFVTKVSLYSLTMHLVKKGYPVPTDEEMNENANETIRRMLGLKTGV